jgi:hypothetical protein
MKSFLTLAFACVLLLGCGKGGPSYNEALQTYNAELELLKHLEDQRAAIDQKYEHDHATMRDIAVRAAERGKDTSEDTELLNKIRAAWTEDLNKIDEEIKRQQERINTAAKARDEAEKNR